MKEYWGYHLILDCSGCVKDRVKSRENLEAFVKTLVKRIDMTLESLPSNILQRMTLQQLAILLFN